MAWLGISTGVLVDKRDIDTLLAFRPDVVEFYNYPSSALPWIRQVCSDLGARAALHAPLPYDQNQPLRRFAPTGPERADAEAARDLALRTVSCAADIGALHVVVHYPSPYTHDGRSIPVEIEEFFLGPVAELAEMKRVRVLVENLSSNPACRLPRDYRLLLDRYPSLGFCLDFGHAYDVDPKAGVERFARQLGPEIGSCHVYSARKNGQSRHEPIHPSHASEDGWLDPRAAVKAVTKYARPAVFVLEPRPLRPGELERAVAGAAWLRELIRAEEG